MIEHMTAAVADPTLESADAPSVGWASGPLGAAQAAQRELARQYAARARALAEFAASRPASADRQPGGPGAMSEARRAARPEILTEVSEWTARELVVALSITAEAAERELADALTLVHKLPATLVALETGQLHQGQLWPMLTHVGPIRSARVRAAVEAQLLAWVAARPVTTPAQLAAKALRIVAVRDARDAARRLREALGDRGVHVRRGGRLAPGMAEAVATLTEPEAQALLDALGRYADAVDESHLPVEQRRSRGQKMADCLLDLVLRPGETDLSPVQAQLLLVASIPTLLGGDEPGEVGGQPVPAEMVRALARALGLIPDPTPPAAPETAPAPSSTPSPAAEPELPACRCVDPEQLLDSGCPVHGPAWERAEAAWWAELEDRAARGDWPIDEAPPDAQARIWAEQQAWLDPDPDPDPDPDSARWPGEPPPDPDPDTLRARARGWLDPPPAAAGTGWWQVADRSLLAATAAQLRLERAIEEAELAVARAWRHDDADEQAWRATTAGRVAVATDTLDAIAAAGPDAAAIIGALLQRTGGGGLVERPRIAVVDATSGALLTLTDAPELRAHATHGAGLGPPGPTAGYRPGAALDRFVRARDRRCRFPGCRRRVPRGGELDHDRPYPDGETSAANLAGYCTTDHRGKHQAPGWRHELAPDGTLTVTTPTGLTATTTPPAY
jgi:hypothetical protein